jgi:D-3-phosphoglycerate dehydrogenase
MSQPRVWFERPVLADLRDAVAARTEMLGPAEATPDEPYAALSGAEGIVASVHRYDGALMDQAPQLKVISRTGIGYDTVDVAAATARGIAVCNAPDGPTISTAEHAVALMLMAAKQVRRAELALRSGGSDFYARHTGLELRGRTLGLVGFGRIAREVAAIAAGLGMRIVAYDPFIDAASAGEGTTLVSDIVDLLATADVVSVHVPLTPEARHLFDASTFAAMKPGAIFVNTARGGLVDLDGLAAALDSGRLFAAGLDVTDPEPLPPDHPLLARDDVVVTPHVAAATIEAKRRIFETAFSQVLQVLAGERPPHLVNPEVWDGLTAAASSLHDHEEAS